MADKFGRRQILEGVATLATSLPIAGSNSPDTAQLNIAARPNIVSIIADDMGYADIGCYGRRDLKTPNIDEIAKGGVRFVQAYANSRVCTASRVAIITGRFQVHLPVGLEEPLSGSSKNIDLAPDHPTLPSLLKEVGYGTTLIDKWHLGSPPNFGPIKSGYDHFYGYRGGTLDYYLHTGRTGAPDFWDDDRPIEQDGYTTDLFGDHTVKVIGDYTRQKKPFLLSLHFNAPHWPWEGPGNQAESERLRGKDQIDYDASSQETYRRMIAAIAKSYIWPISLAAEWH